MKLKVTTPQEAFDTVVRHLAQQNEKSMTVIDPHTGSKSCAYFIIDDDKNILNRCAVGALIDETTVQFDDLAHLKDWNSASVQSDHLLSEFELDDQNFFWEHMWLMVSLQEAHDEDRSRDHNGKFNDWDRMREIATEFGLSAAVIDEVLAARTA